MTEKEMWNLYTNHRHVQNKTYDAWRFGGDDAMANELAKLAADGIKTATASAPSRGFEHDLRRRSSCCLYNGNHESIYLSVL